jgi:DDE superfamily endonuclease
MEQVLDVYAAPHPPDAPLIAMDEAAKQLRGEVAAPLPAAPGRPARQDHHYTRAGAQSLFCFFDPLRGWRRVAVRDRRGRRDWAEEVRHLLEVDYPDARKVTLVCDNLNTHHIASLYAAFDAETAHRLARRLELISTPRHGSWLKVAEIELSALAVPCLDRRIGTAAELRSEVAQWAADRNADRSGVDWRFTTADARVKLRHLYPQVKT